jgi:hypothetical protein
MTVPADAAINVATGTASVGVQAQVVHGDVSVYQLAGDSPEDLYRTGASYLDGGMPAKAREFIGAARARGYVTSEVEFHWLLALLSGRALRQLSAEDLASLTAARERLPPQGGGEWATGLKVIHCLLDALDAAEADLPLILSKLDGLGKVQQGKIFRHLDRFFSGPIEDQIWNRALGRASAERMDRDRVNRVWMFFQPEPIGPRVRWPDQPAITTAARFRLITAAALSIAAAGYVGWLLLERGQVLALSAGLIGITSACIGFAHGVDWCHRVDRLRAKGEQFRTAGSRAPKVRQGGFADNVDRLFNHYFATYVPHGADRAAWLAATDGIRRSLRDEIIEVYRESRVDAKRVAWLIRHRVSDVKQRWQDNTLLDYQEQWRTPASAKAAVVLCLAVLLACGGWVPGDAVRAEPLSSTALAALMAAGDWIAVKEGLRIKLERRRYGAQKVECQQRQEAAAAAFAQWQARLAPRPADAEMALWLDCDRKALMGRAMAHYQLTPSDVIAHAFIEAPRHVRQESPGSGWPLALFEIPATRVLTHRGRGTPGDHRSRLRKRGIPRLTADELPLRRDRSRGSAGPDRPPGWPGPPPARTNRGRYTIRV